MIVIKQLKIQFVILFITFTIFSFFINSIYASEDLDLLCMSDIVVDYDSGNILYSKAINNKVYPASTTKILTAILIIENMDLNTAIVVSKNAVESTPIGSSVMGVKAEEIYTIEQLLYGLLLPSGNDAAIVLAEAMCGNVDDFVILMNKKLEELGCNDTHFTNPHGFHDDNHYTTASDMAKLFRYCLKNDTFRKIISTNEYVIPPTNKTSTETTLINTNRMLNENYPSLYYEYMVGGKTGYTDEARGTFIAFCQKDDKTIIVGAFNGSQLQKAIFVDTKALSNYVFENFNNEIIVDKNDYTFTITDKLNNVRYKVRLDEDIYSLITLEKYKIEYNIELNFENNNINETIGNLNIKFTQINDEDNYFSNTYPLKIINKEFYYDINSNINIIIVISILAVIILLSIIIYKNKTNRKNRFKKYMGI